MTAELDLTETVLIGENDAYRFGIGLLCGRWIGYAAPNRSPAEKAFQEVGLEVSPQMLFVFSQVSDGCELGTLDRNRAILLTGAVTQDMESSYGGVERWFVAEDLRGDPEKFRCVVCDRVGCDGRECGDQNYFEDDYEPQ